MSTTPQSSKRHDAIILGINLSHDTACAGIVNGEVKVAIQEERLNRVKHCTGVTPFGRIIPFRSIRYVCDYLGITPSDVDLFVVNSCRRNAIEHLRAQLLGIPDDRIADLPHPGHHLAHAYSSFYCSPFEEAAVIIVDTNGSFLEKPGESPDAMEISSKEHFTAFHGSLNNGLHPLITDWVRPGEVSLGELYCIYSAALQLTPKPGGHYGVDCPLSAGGKLMGLASYDLHKTPASELTTLQSDGHLSIPLTRVIDHLEKKDFVSSRKPGLEEIFGFEMRPYVDLVQRGSKSLEEPRYLALAGEAQRELERALLEIARRVHREMGGRCDNLCLAGGTMLNVTACTRLLDEGPFKRIFVQPAANDAGIAIGAGIYGYRHLLPAKTALDQPYLKKPYNTCLGKTYANDDVVRAIEKYATTTKKNGKAFTARRLSTFEEKATALLPRILEDRIVAVFEGRSEFGPRALGHRSLLASPANAAMKDKMNELKHREWYRPVAPVVLEEDFATYFDAPFESVPFMTLAARCKPITSERAPAVRHVDGSARPQTVTADQSPLVHHLLMTLKSTGKLPMLINTSFNVDGEPIVETPEHAVQAFLGADLLDAILIEDWLLETSPS